jgi:hypothetical protein
LTTSNLQLTLRERNDEQVYLAVTKDGAAYDLTGATIELILKSAVSDADSTGTTLSTTTGDIVITNAAGGLATANVSSTVTTTPVKNWTFRLDVIVAGKRKTAGYGTYTVIDL